MMDLQIIKPYITQIRGVSYKPSDTRAGLSENSVPLLRANNIGKNNKLNFDDLVYVDRAVTKEAQYLKKGDILICASSGSKDLVGKAAYITEDLDVVFGAFCKVVRPNSNINARYLGYFFDSTKYRKAIASASNGANINNIRTEDIDNLYLPIVTNKEQEKYVRVSEIVYSLIEKFNRELNDLDTIIKSRFIEMFGDPFSNPKGWDKATVGEVCYYIKDGPHKSLQDLGEGHGRPFISVRNIVNGRIDFSTAKYISDSDYAEAIKKCHPEKGDILYSKGGTTGIAKLIDIDVEFANWVHVAVLKFNKSMLNGVFFENMLNGDYCYTQSQRLTKGIANRDLVLSAMAKIQLFVPPLELQNQFADFVAQVDKSKLAVQKSLNGIETLKKSLMQQYFG